MYDLRKDLYILYHDNYELVVYSSIQTFEGNFQIELDLICWRVFVSFSFFLTNRANRYLVLNIEPLISTSADEKSANQLSTNTTGLELSFFNKIIVINTIHHWVPYYLYLLQKSTIG